MSHEPLSLPLSWFLFPSKLAFGGFLGCFLSCSFGSGPGLSFWVSALLLGIQKASLLSPQLSLSLYSHRVTLPICDFMLGPTVILYKAEGQQETYEYFHFFCPCSATCLVATHCSCWITVLQEPHGAVVQLFTLVSQQAFDLI